MRRLPPLDGHPDAVFVEDTAVVVAELAVVARPGAPSRRGETTSVEGALRELRPTARIEGPGTLDGGDVLRAGRVVWVGRSTRTNADGARQLAALLAPFGYDVREAPFEGCLHLKTAATTLADDLVVLNPDWVDPAVFGAVRHVAVDPDEPFGANVLRLGDTVLAPSGAPRTIDRIRSAGAAVRAIDMSELAKAEGGLTCCCVLVDGIGGPLSAR